MIDDITARSSMSPKVGQALTSWAAKIQIAAPEQGCVAPLGLTLKGGSLKLVCKGAGRVGLRIQLDVE